MHRMSRKTRRPNPYNAQKWTSRAISTSAVQRIGSCADALDQKGIPAHQIWALTKGAIVAPTAPLTWVALLAPARYFTVRAHLRAAAIPRKLMTALGRRSRRLRRSGQLPLMVGSSATKVGGGGQRIALPRKSHNPSTGDSGAVGSAQVSPSRKSRRGRVEVVDASINAFISSDLHRTPPGQRDWARSQGTADIYAAVLEYYGQKDWYLIENGDVEDFWMVGGSAWGVAYDICRLTGTALGPAGKPLRRAAYTEHLNRIVQNHAPIYDRIERLFHLHGRYLRLIGNHDDVYYDPHVVDALQLHFPGLRPSDYLVLADTPNSPGGDGQLIEPRAVITHGHITDPWNSAGGAWRGKTVTWTASLLGDLPGGGELGPPSETSSMQPFLGEASNQLTSLGHWMSLDHNHQTLDESQLHRAFAQHWGEGAGPWLLCGHTHTPLYGPMDPSDYSRFTKYINSGSGIGRSVVSGIEWRGAERRSPVLVGFTFGQPADGIGTVVHEYEGNALVRTELVADTGDRLNPADTAHRNRHP